jgi:O-methyltransferase involved in polyketide biosynthesis
LSAEARISHERRATDVAELGEAWLNYFEAHELRAKLMALGFSEVEDLGPPQIAARYFPNRVSTVSNKGGHILRATTI